MEINPNKTKYPSTGWMRKVERYLASGQKSKAIQVLDRAVNAHLPLFVDDPAIHEDSRMAWMYKIELLREWGKQTEALAWTCLECELNPGNITAQALKEKLKKLIKFRMSNDKQSKNVHLNRDLESLWSDVAGMREIKTIIERDVILPIQEPELYKQYGIRLPRGILFYGPPGCGKTHIARSLGKILAFNFIEVKPSDLASTYVHGTQQKIEQLFAVAKSNAPTLIFLDELDALVPNRNEDLYHAYSMEVNEFLVQLNECWKSKILILGATNNLKKIDPAVLRPGRIDKKIFIGPPDLEARVEILKFFMKDRLQDFINWVEIAEEAEFYTSAELEYIVEEAAKIALQRNRQIVGNDFSLAIKSNPPSLNENKIDSMKQPIGFI